MPPVFETEMERRRRLRAPGWENDILRDGERLRFGMMLTDSAAKPSSTLMKDTTMTTSINDAVQQVPSEFRHKMQYVIAEMQASDGMAARQGISNAQNLIGRMSMLRDGFGAKGSGMVTDSDKTHLTQVADHLQAHIDATQLRLTQQGR